ncbi:MAG TPA: SnoaL-like domain-containing protein [Chryseosolibacter sp.]|nr:SnoaL-like domain-containing protein [Chryseosolibacter sp.]
MSSKNTTDEKTMTTREVADRFHELAQQEKWFEIQDELFSNEVRSIEPDGSPYLGYAEGKAEVRKKGEDFVRRIEVFHSGRTTAPIVSGNHFVVGREKDMTVRPHGRIKIHELMVYEVRDGQIVAEQFFY